MFNDLYDIPCHFARASQDIPSSQNWLRREWEEARKLTEGNSKAILVVDEIQMVTQWSSIVKAMWDEDADKDRELLVLLTGSSSLLLHKGLRESLTGRFELHHCLQWSLEECRNAFNFTLEDYLYFGGYPGAAPLKGDKNRWLNYMMESIIEPSISRDVISLDDIHKPALMRSLFSLGAAYSGQEISYRKLMGQLDDAGNATTIAHYLDLLSSAGLLSGLQKYSPKILKTRASSPRLIAHDTSLMVAMYGQYRDFLLTDPERKGHLVESAVGAYLLKRAQQEHFEVFWWREGTSEVDFVVQDGRNCTAIEVKSGRIKNTHGLDSFHKAFSNNHNIVVGSSNTSLKDFLLGKIPLF